MLIQSQHDKELEPKEKDFIRARVKDLMASIEDIDVVKRFDTRAEGDLKPTLRELAHDDSRDESAVDVLIEVPNDPQAMTTSRFNRLARQVYMACLLIRRVSRTVSEVSDVP